MKLQEVLNGASYEVINGILDKEISNIQYDSRKIKKGDLFICLSGFLVDGHEYVESAIEAGATTIICEKDIDIKNIDNDITVIKVIEGRKTLAIMSANYYGHPTKDLKLVGITGTNGKTTSVYIMKSILEKAGEKVGLVGTVANYIGDLKIEAERTTPESLELQKLFRDMVDAGCEYCVMEVSSHSLELDRVYGCEFEIGIFSNLTRDHIDFHKTFENYYKAKYTLFQRSKKCLINIDDNYGYRIVQDLHKAEGEDKEVITFSIREESDLKASNIKLEELDILFDIKNDNYKLMLPGEYNIYNALGAIGAAKLLGINKTAIQEGLIEVIVPGRCERIGYKYDIPYEIVIDFAHTPDGMKNILETLRKFTKNRLIAVYGSGGDRDKIKRAELGRVGTEIADLVIFTSDNPRNEDVMDIIKEMVFGNDKTNFLAIPDRVEAIKLALDMAEAGDIVTLVGKGHETYQINPEGKVHFDEREVVDEILEGKKRV